MFWWGVQCWTPSPSPWISRSSPRTFEGTVGWRRQEKEEEEEEEKKTRESQRMRRTEEGNPCTRLSVSADSMLVSERHALTERLRTDDRVRHFAAARVCSLSLSQSKPKQTKPMILKKRSDTSTESNPGSLWCSSKLRVRLKLSTWSCYIFQRGQRVFARSSEFNLFLYAFVPDFVRVRPRFYTRSSQILYAFVPDFIRVHLRFWTRSSQFVPDIKRVRPRLYTHSPQLFYACNTFLTFSTRSSQIFYAFVTDFFCSVLEFIRPRPSM